MHTADTAGCDQWKRRQNITTNSDVMVLALPPIGDTGTLSPAQSATLQINTRERSAIPLPSPKNHHCGNLPTRAASQCFRVLDCPSYPLRLPALPMAPKQCTVLMAFESVPFATRGNQSWVYLSSFRKYWLLFSSVVHTKRFHFGDEKAKVVPCTT